MVHKVTTSFTRQLNDHLKLCFNLPEDIAFVSPPKDTSNALPANRVSVSIINIERELGGGISFNNRNGSGQSQKSAPAWPVNLYLLVSVVTPEKQYKESLQLMGGVMSFVQKDTRLAIQGEARPCTIEPVNLSLNELSNLWGICGGSYVPSLVCKIGSIVIDGMEITDLAYIIKGYDNTVGGTGK